MRRKCTPLVYSGTKSAWGGGLSLSPADEFIAPDPQVDPQQETSGRKQWSGKHDCLRIYGTKMPPKRQMEAFRGWAISW